MADVQLGKAQTRDAQDEQVQYSIAAIAAMVNLQKVIEQTPIRNNP